MKTRSFGDFVDKKKRESIHQLTIIKQLLEKNGMRVDNFLETDEGSDPYIFCRNPGKNASFDGVRIYKIGTDLAFRIQKESKTHPYGSAYPLPIESMFNDFLSDENIDEQKAGKKIIEAVGKELRRFFEKSVEAEEENRSRDVDREGSGILTRTSGMDYSSMVYSKS